MKVAIFGDSHGDVSYMDWRKVAPHIGLGWPELLSKFHKTSNYCAGGSGLWYSFKLFQDRHRKFEKVIFLPSQNHRFTLKLPERNTKIHVVPGFVDGDQLRQSLMLNDTPLDNNIVEAAAGYIDHILDYDKEHFLGNLLIKEIHNIRPDAIIVKCFNSNSESLGMSDLSRLEIEHWNTSVEELRADGEHCDYRKCHMSDENNEMVFKKILAAINNNKNFVDFNQSDFIMPKQPLNRYIFKVSGRKGNV